MTKAEIIADIASKSLSVGKTDETGSGGYPDITRYTAHTVILVDDKIQAKEYGYWVYKEGTADEEAYYVATDV